MTVTPETLLSVVIISVGIYLFVRRWRSTETKNKNASQNQPSGTGQTNTSSPSPSNKTGTRPRNVTNNQPSGTSGTTSQGGQSGTTPKKRSSPSRGNRPRAPKNTTNKTSSKSSSKPTDSSAGIETIDFDGKQVTNDSGKKIVLGNKLGDGKEGTVYSSASSAIKIYKGDRRADDTIEQKIQVMIENRPEIKSHDDHRWFAWPEELIYYRNRFIGYEMPAVDVDNAVNIRTHIRNELSSSSGLTENKLKLAHNIATVVSLVHKKGHAVGDFNYENILIEDSKVTMIDCDAYSIKGDSEEFHGKTMYDQTIPPEGRPTDSIRNAQMADNFNLAKWVFRIVTGNRNPFQAKGELAATGSLLKMMQENPFPYWNPKSGLIQPAVGQSQYDAFPAELRLLFESAFLGGKFHPYKRPSPEVWRTILGQIYRRKKMSDPVSSREQIQWNPDENSGTSPGRPTDFTKLSKSKNIHSVSIDNRATVVGRITNVEPLNDFEHYGETKFVSNVTIQDDTGSIVLTFWNHDGVVAARSFHPGLTIEATGTVESALDYMSADKEVHVDEYDIKPHHDNCRQQVNDLNEEPYNVHTRGIIVGIGPLRKANRSRFDHKLNVVLVDESGYCHVELRDAMAEPISRIPLGLTLEIINGEKQPMGGDDKKIVVKEENKLGNLIPPVLTDINVNSKDIDTVLDPNPGASISKGRTVDLRGSVSHIEKKPGETGKIEQISIEAKVGKIEIDLQNEFAEYGIKKGDNIFATSIKITGEKSGKFQGGTTGDSVITILS